MRLIGLLDSPFVRRVAITMRMVGIPFEHRPLSVFRDAEAFQAVNPVIKAPTLVTDAGLVLMESGVILEHLAWLYPDRARLMPVAPDEHARASRILGLALAAAEKTVQHVYEYRLRPEAKRHAPTIERIEGQIAAAYAALEAAASAQQPWLFGPQPLQPDITACVVWRFTRTALSELVTDDAHPNLSALSSRAEALAAFQACPPLP
ncbi:MULTISPECIES: glutathione S-transferase family protein [unclassified Methylobacterium]|jgi:glutathione S-transferase|uniref:glutathione S-transferase family protein n=1 Tax=unclassified Methylobacterium TaxID=2615210 RepID=UPI001355CED4|nr:glutathione S-transferase family protein [Methylobacterium sp. 2A]MWV25515.1 glutathione S-transferase [Methylobacterium sp. 2A]